MTPRTRTLASLLMFMIVVLANTVARAQEDAAVAPGPAVGLPAGNYDESIPTPSQFFGFELGEWHIRYDRVVAYFRELDRLSGRFQLIEHGESFEKRPLIAAYFGAGGSTVARMLQIPEDDLASDGGEKIAIWLGYGVHGNEASATNAAPAVLYHLVASQDPSVQDLLANSRIILDPCYNPDGYARFVQWVNGNRSKTPNADPADREHNEPWPSGRTNHYGFDLNRDWLLAVHPETRGRLDLFHALRPHVLTDVHEMGTNSTYFFQPGVPSRQGTWTLDENLDLTRRVAKYHANALDDAGALYWSEERFDDFYYGKGSTYPDIFGGIGILFEQASSRGHVQESENGLLSYRKATAQQVVTSLSTLRAAREERDAMRQYRKTFDEAADRARQQDPVKGYVFGSEKDRTRVEALRELLGRHRVLVFELGKRFVAEAADGHPAGTRRVFPRETSYFVPTDQPNYYAVKTLFEKVTEFEDDVFYDVSSWTMPLAYGLPYATIDSESMERLSIEPLSRREPSRPIGTDDDSNFIVFPPGDSALYPVAFRLATEGGSVRIATRPFSIAQADEEPRRIEAGAVIADVRKPEHRSAAIAAIAESSLSFLKVSTGLTPTGVDFGSPNVQPLESLEVLLVCGEGTSGYEAAELWHACDEFFGLTVTRVDRDDLPRTDLDRYTHILMPSGGYSSWSDSAVEDLRDWVRGGGVVIAQRSAATWAGENLLRKDDEDDDDADSDDEAEEDEEPVRYVDAERDRAKELIGGAIFEGVVDTTHPLGFGLDSGRIPLFRRSAMVLPLSDDPYANAVRYPESPRLSGYASDENIEAIAGTAAVIATRLGAGAVIQFADNPNFRGTWLGTRQLFGNALLYGRAIDRTAR